MADNNTRYYEDEREDEFADQGYEPSDETVYEEDMAEEVPETESAADEQPYDDGMQDEPVEQTALEQLLDFLVEALTTAQPVPFNNAKRIVNAKMILDIVEDIRNCLPDEIRHSMDIMADRDHIIEEAKARANTRLNTADARADAIVASAQKQAEELESSAKKRADDMVAAAEERARHMIDQSEIVRLAHEEADRMCEEARAEANEQRLEANRYAESILREMERDVQATLDAVRRSIDNVSRQGN